MIPKLVKKRDYVGDGLSMISRVPPNMHLFIFLEQHLGKYFDVTDDL